MKGRGPGLDKGAPPSGGVRVLALCGCALLALGGAARADAAPIVSGQARIEFLSPTLVRLEYAPSGHFVDAPTAVVVGRRWPEVAVRVRDEQGWIIASTTALTVRYRIGSGAFTPASLAVSYADLNGRTRTWRPGETDPANLGGMPYSLDNVGAKNLPAGLPDTQTPVNDAIPGIDLVLPPAKPGILSRSGFALIDDSRSPVWNAARSWIEPRPQPAGQDWYFFGYGSRFDLALREYAQLCGPVPMVPRYVFGPMVTDLNFEYFPGSYASRQPQVQAYDQSHIQTELARLRAADIPVDTLVLDFAWHNYGWDGGYDWSPLIPHPQALMQWLRARGFKLSLNDHPGYVNTDENILSPKDSQTPQVLKALGLPPLAKPTFDLDVSAAWQFAPDPKNQGMAARWYADAGSNGRWKSIRLLEPWQQQGYPTARTGWYRARVHLPAQLPRRLYLYLGEVSSTYRVFINGREVMHSSVHWPARLTYTDLAPYVVAGRDNLIVLRVESGEREGGVLLAPVAIRNSAPPPRISFDLSDQRQARVFMSALHGPLMRAGVDFWWVDGGSGATRMPGLNPQLWTNKVFYDYTQSESGKRGFILGRYGDYGSERYPAFFTGDTQSQWPVLAYEVAFTARGGNLLMAYISHDIGGFHGKKIDFDLYARWIEFGAFSPILRLHSAHENPSEGNLRMPWTYGEAGMALVRKYFTLKTQLIPYLYTYAWRAHHDAEPILRPLYLAEPEVEESYRHSHEYFLGDELLVAPVVDPSGAVRIYLPAGEWVEFFTGKHYTGPMAFTAHYAADETPVFARAGALVPEQRAGPYSDAHPLDPLLIEVYGAAPARFELFEDDGSSLDYQKGAYALTDLTHTVDADATQHLAISPARGTFTGQLTARGYVLHLHGGERPRAAWLDGKPIAAPAWDAGHGTATIRIPSRSIRTRTEVAWR